MQDIRFFSIKAAVNGSVIPKSHLLDVQNLVKNGISTTKSTNLNWISSVGWSGGSRHSAVEVAVKALCHPERRFFFFNAMDVENCSIQCKGFP